MLVGFVEVRLDEEVGVPVRQEGSDSVDSVSVRLAQSKQGILEVLLLGHSGPKLVLNLFIEVSENPAELAAREVFAEAGKQIPQICQHSYLPHKLFRKRRFRVVEDAG